MEGTAASPVTVSNTDGAPFTAYVPDALRVTVAETREVAAPRVAATWMATSPATAESPTLCSCDNCD